MGRARLVLAAFLQSRFCPLHKMTIQCCGKGTLCTSPSRTRSQRCGELGSKPNKATRFVRREQQFQTVRHGYHKRLHVISTVTGREGKKLLVTHATVSFSNFSFFVISFTIIFFPFEHLLASVFEQFQKKAI